ncbi:MAG: hypothetical protein R2708_22055 [Vicinamibacterales bacterium]
MRTGTPILLVTAAVLATSTWLAAGRAAQSATTMASEPASGRPADAAARQAIATPGASTDYVGSAACESCHEDAFARWKASLHIQMTRPVAEATILGDFSRTARLSAYGRS